MRIQNLALRHTERIMKMVDDRPMASYLDGFADATYVSAIEHYKDVEKRERAANLSATVGMVVGMAIAYTIMKKRNDKKKEIKEEA